MTAKGTEKLDFLVPELLPVTIKFALTLRTRNPKNFRHSGYPDIVANTRIFHFERSEKSFLDLSRSLGMMGGLSPCLLWPLGGPYLT
jgi:hypothetical protein